MSLGEKLLRLRKKEGLSQEEVAEKLNVSRQTVSKWETGQTVPELAKAKLLSQLYNVRYGYLISEADEDIDPTDTAALADQIDWSSAWSKKYPVLEQYHALPGIEAFEREVADSCDRLRQHYGLSLQDTFLIYKDIVYRKYRKDKNLD